MIGLDMFGKDPSENTANSVNAPPENRSMNCGGLCWLPCAAAASAWTLMLGTGTCEPSRYTAMISSVNRIFFRRSGILNALTKALSMRRRVLELGPWWERQSTGCGQRGGLDTVGFRPLDGAARSGYAIALPGDG